MVGENNPISEKIKKEILLGSFKKILEDFENKHNVKISGIVLETGEPKFAGVVYSETEDNFDKAVIVFVEEIKRRLEETGGDLPFGYEFIDVKAKPLVGESLKDAQGPGSQTDLS